jgi:hypothetical protein
MGNTRLSPRIRATLPSLSARLSSRPMAEGRGDFAGGKGAYLMVEAGSPGPHHSALFEVTEESIRIGIDILASLIRTPRHPVQSRPTRP